MVKTASKSTHKPWHSSC